MFSRHHRKARILFGLSDVVLTALAFAAAYETRIWLRLDRVFYIILPVQVLLVGSIVLFWVALGYWMDIYDRLDAAHPKTILRETFRQCLLGSVALVLLQFLLRLDLSRPFLAFFAIYAWILLCLFRLNAGQLAGILRREFGSTHYVLIAGVGERALSLGRTLERSSGYGLRLTGFLSDQDGVSPPVVKLEHEYPLYPISSLPELLERQVVDEIIFAVESRGLSGLEEVMLQCDEEGVRTHVAVDFFPHINSDVYLEKLGGFPLLTFAAAPHDEVRLLAKRVIDVVLASAALVLLAPLMALVALIIRLTSPGPAIFRQVRCGLNGRRFMFYKFRSMCANAEELKASLAHLNRKQTAFKIPDDPRLTSVGRLLRKFSVDEWPQLWNVVRGDMSIVGPRPAVPEEVEKYKRWQRRRLRMRPGLTCLWALQGRDHLDFETWMKTDMEYIDNWSLVLDWKIMLKTIPSVLSGKGAH